MLPQFCKRGFASIQRMAVIGGGQLGTGIALHAANLKIPVSIVEGNNAALENCQK